MHERHPERKPGKSMRWVKAIRSWTSFVQALGSLANTLVRLVKEVTNLMNACGLLIALLLWLWPK